MPAGDTGGLKGASGGGSPDIRPKTGPHSWQLAFAISPRKMLLAPEDQLTLVEVDVSRDMTQDKYQVVIPTREHTDPFRAAPIHSAMKTATYKGLCPALGPGARVVVVEGGEKGRMGYIWRVGEELRNNRRVRVAKVQELAEGSSRLSSFWVEVSQLRRHILDEFCPINIQDRVSVVAGVLYRGVSGRVREIGNGIATIQATPGQVVVGALDDRNSFDVDVRYLHRELLRGDLVRVSRGANKGRVGLILDIRAGGMLDVWDGAYTDPDLLKSAEAEAQVIQVLASSVELADAGFTAPSAPFTRTSEVGQLEPEIQRSEAEVEQHERKLDTARFVQGDLRQGLKDYNEYSAGRDDEATRDHIRASYMLQITKASLPFLVNIAEQDRLAKEEQLKLAYTGKRFEGIEVQVAFTHRYKGFRGIVVGDHDSEERVKRLGRKRTKGRDRHDLGGIVVTIRGNASNTQVEAEIEFVVHVFTKLPLAQARYLPEQLLTKGGEALTKGGEALFTRPAIPRVPTPPALNPADTAWEPDPSVSVVGELNGEWMLAPELVRKRVDVVIKGLSMAAGKHTKTILALEGKRGWLVPTQPLTLVNHKLTVYGAGKNGLNHPVVATCIRPLRCDQDGLDLDKVQIRVVVIGPDIDGDATSKGRYGFTEPALSVHGAETRIVGVRLEEPPGVHWQLVQFPFASLCIAKNIQIVTQDFTFETTPLPTIQY
ncbi:hypothetical protein C8R46DRAFT_1228005 [Mycena filopes]|nr:hypothetical protein C8R46DRAFT_1228005 [Mycena filopes]